MSPSQTPSGGSEECPWETEAQSLYCLRNPETVWPAPLRPLPTGLHPTTSLWSSPPGLALTPALHPGQPLAEPALHAAPSAGNPLSLMWQQVKSPQGAPHPGRGSCVEQMGAHRERGLGALGCGDGGG